MNEFNAIEKYFLKLTQQKADALSLKDDAAVLAVPAGYELVVTSDTLNAGTHFLKDAAAGDIAHKALRVNLSDLAAMGAKPFAYQLNIAFPGKPSAAWLKGFTDALLKDQKRFGIFCSGGDTTSIKGPLSISITAMGLVKKGQAWKRSGARAGDDIILTHPVGDAWIGLQMLRKKMKAQSYFIERYYRPSPRFIDFNQADPGLRRGSSIKINAAIDISDGLIADLGHVCEASGLKAEIMLENIRFSAQAEKLGINPEKLLTGGDDYELLLAVAPKNSKAVMAQLRKQKLQPQIIGRFSRGKPGVQVMDKNGKRVLFSHSGWTHF